MDGVREESLLSRDTPRGGQCVVASFDRVNHDRLMARLSTRIKDKRVLKLIRSFLTSGVMIGGLEEPTKEGTPQGGPLSPLLSNIAVEVCQVLTFDNTFLTMLRRSLSCFISVSSLAEALVTAL
jgi:retron-type reverse transcriptase